MVVLVQANVLTVGLNGKNKVLQELPIRLIAAKSGADATHSLRSEKIDSVISEWNLDDMEDGWFLKKLRAVKPQMPTIALIETGNIEQEIAARSLGVSAVLTKDTGDKIFKQTLANLLGLTDITDIKAISSIETKRSTNVKERIQR